MNKKIKIILISITLIFILAAIQTLPVFVLKPMGVKELYGKSVIVYYQSGDEKGAKEVFNILEKTSDEIRRKLKFKNEKPTEVYVYMNQYSLWIRKYGLITVLAAPKWFVGDNKGDKVLMISPYTNVKGNDHDNILSVATHELVHTIIYQVYPKLSYWNNNGAATFLAKQSPKRGFVNFQNIPTIDDMKNEDEKKFGNIGGYQYSYTYIEFLDKKYGWDKVLELIKGVKTYNEIFSKSEQEIYDEWVEFLKVNYTKVMNISFFMKWQYYEGKILLRTVGEHDYTLKNL